MKYNFFITLEIDLKIVDKSYKTYTKQKKTLPSLLVRVVAPSEIDVVICGARSRIPWGESVHLHAGSGFPQSPGFPGWKTRTRRLLKGLGIGPRGYKTPELRHYLWATGHSLVITDDLEQVLSCGWQL